MNEREKAISLLLASFPGNEGKAELKSLLTAYDVALQGVSDRNVGIAVRAFVQGRVPGHNPAFRPRPAELAAYIRPMQETDDRLAAAARERRKQLMAPEVTDPTPEERAAAIEKAEAAKRHIAAAVNKMQEAKQ